MEGDEWTESKLERVERGKRWKGEEKEGELRRRWRSVHVLLISNEAEVLSLISSFLFPPWFSFIRSFFSNWCLFHFLLLFFLSRIFVAEKRLETREMRVWSLKRERNQTDLLTDYWLNTPSYDSNAPSSWPERARRKLEIVLFCLCLDCYATIKRRRDPPHVIYTAEDIIPLYWKTCWNLHLFYPWPVVKM